MDAVGEKPNLQGKRDRAPATGAPDSDNPAQFLDSTRGGGNMGTLGSRNGRREQAPAKGAGVSDNHSTFMVEGAMDTSETRGGGIMDALGSGNGKREQAPARGTEDPDNPTQFFDSTRGGGSVGALGSGNGKRGWAPAEGVTDSDITTQSIGKNCRLGDLHLASVADTEVAKEHVQWRMPEMKGRLIRRLGWIPGRRVCWPVGGQCYLRGLQKSATVFRNRDCRRPRNAHLRTLFARRNKGN